MTIFEDSRNFSKIKKFKFKKFIFRWKALLFKKNPVAFIGLEIELHEYKYVEIFF